MGIHTPPHGPLPGSSAFKLPAGWPGEDVLPLAWLAALAASPLPRAIVTVGSGRMALNYTVPV